MRRRADRRFAALASILAAGLTAGAPPCAAQVEAGFDAAASVVKYDGYLASGAASFSPSLAWQSPRTTVTARGTVLVFESGNQSFQGTVTAGSFSSAVGPVRLEASGDAGASSYAGISWFAHGLARLRLHVLSGGWGLWAGPLGGMISRQGAGYAAAGYTAGAWTRGASGALEIGWTGVTVGDITYRDLQARARWRRGAFEVQALAASRSTSPAGPGGGYYDVTATVQLTPRLAVVAAAGRYPSDPVSGSIAGSYVTAGLRIAPRAAHLRAARPPARGMAPPPPPPAADSGAAGSAAPGRPVADLERRGGQPVLVVRVAGASLVEVMGDFTGWQPVALAAAGEARWRYPAALPPGMYRFNLRVDGGPWLAPGGLPVAADEFGGAVAVVVVP